MLLPAGAVVFFLFTELASRNPSFTERWYSQKIYPVIAGILSNISSIIPFSLDDIFYLILISVPFLLIFLLLFKRIQFAIAGKSLLNLFAGVYILFYLLWGFNYFREPVAQRLGYEERNADKQEFLSFLMACIDEVNTLHCSFEETDKTEIDRQIEESYKKLAPLLQLDYPMGKRNDKKITFSWFYAKSGITGYFGPFFNEVHVNKKVLPIEFPFVLAHEKAHQLGITSEAEANFYSWLVCSNSPSQQIRYSAKLFILFHFLRQAHGLEEYKSLVQQISPEVLADFEDIRQHWKKLRNETLNKTASKVNDAYLKTNKIEKGIKDYNGVVKHVMNFSLDSAFQERYELLPN